jgi:hypothetical protein
VNERDEIWQVGIEEIRVIEIADHSEATSHPSTLLSSNLAVILVIF